ncbi:flavin reductase family protein [Streptomyces antarcticus]|uniref:flavin reductase family protein n=1 Tax=Streptomyces antarcticus TaxID=2996458 RepID=UPI00226F1300|nr:MULTISPECIES: flavin reductase family protein [unclassified Streptomyces]MCY0942906.1 flavin reductase family protein [Streptomyces sp. H34-AA3]MCY0953047.1 flavin reductase family protein [Streptomyces sp. H27-S2]MCZ4083134.1 flavin reductase family protein [Streptomyces sp. H34-S5]
MSTLTAAPPRAAVIGDPARLRRAFGAFATGVTVVTVGGASPRGMTANSFTSVSLDPPLVLVSVGKEALMHRRLAEADTFSVSVLGAGQEGVARHFADRSRPMGAGQFDAVDHLPGRAAGAPLIAGAAAHFECAKWRAYDAGDHTLYLGELLAMDESPEREPLVFHRGAFREVAPAPLAQAQRGGAR